MSKHPFRLLAGLLGILTAGLLLCGLALPSQYHDTYLGEMPFKLRLLQDTPGPRIVVIGGSAVPFALNSALMDRYLPDYTAVDFGLYADLGLPILLDWAQDELREGDLIVLMPEQDEQVLSGFTGGESAWQAMDGAWALLPRVSSARYEALAAAYPLFAGKKLRYALLGQPQAAGVYARSAFNDRGDMASPERKRNILPGGWLSTRPICFDAGLPTDGMVQELNRFAAFARERGAQVVYHLPPMNALAVQGDAAALDAWYEQLSARLDFPILGDPHRCVLDSGWFYDTNFHLNASGSTVFTRLLIEDLKLYLHDTSPTDLPLPEQPAPARQDREGNDEDADLFTYAPGEGGWVLTGLTEQGRLARALVLPTRYSGLPVVGISEGALRDCTALQSVTVQPNIAMLPDGMFRGCTALRTVRLTGLPSDYSVGDDWMQGAAFAVRVPPDRLDAYRRSYSWQRYEAWLLADE